MVLSCLIFIAAWYSLLLFKWKAFQKPCISDPLFLVHELLFHALAPLVPATTGHDNSSGVYGGVVVIKIAVTHIPCFHQSPGIQGITFGQIQGSLQASCNAVPAATPSLPAHCHNLIVEWKDWGALSFEQPFHGKGAQSSFHALLHTLKICLNRQEHLLIQ